MNNFKIRNSQNRIIRFNLYIDDAPNTCKAFLKLLPFSKIFFHARVSGQEIWTDKAPELDIIQENASVFVMPGEIVLGPLKPFRVKTSKCLGIYYGEGKGLDSCNIFGKVFEEDIPILQELGEEIWKHGYQEIFFESI
jgi:hypothetical protein